MRINKAFIGFGIFMLNTLVGFAQEIPAITSILPESGPVGSVVTIKGTNFSATVAENIVYFGAVKAVVNSATSTELSVTVPSGATYLPISVTISGLTAFSSKPFVTTFSGNQVIDFTSFGFNVDFPVGNSLYSIVIGDIDDDSYPDLIVTNSIGNSISIFRNTGTSGDISSASFAPKVDFTTGLEPAKLSLGDLNGDGKLDIVVANRSESSVSVFKNTSIKGSITTNSLATRIDFPTGSSPNSVAIGDLDNDGKPDLVSSNTKDNSLSILKNLGKVGVIDGTTFASKIDVALPNAWIVVLGDIDIDGKLDIVASNLIGNTMSVLKNNSKTGVIDAKSFAAKVDFKTGTSPAEIAIGDLNSDGKPELVVANLNGSSVSIFENTTMIGTINTSSFATKLDLSAPTGTGSVAIGDLNGDGKPDLALASSGSSNFQGTTVSVIRNLHSSGAISLRSFDNYYSFTTGTEPYSVAIGDLNGDQKPDLAVANASSRNISIIPSTIPTAIPLHSIISFTPMSGPVGTTVSIIGKNFSEFAPSNIVKFNGTVAEVKSSTDTSIVAVISNGATTGNITVEVARQLATSKDIFTVTTVNPITIIKQPVGSLRCLNDTSSFIISATGTNLRYQWQFQTSATSIFTDITNTLGFTGATSSILQISGVTNTKVGNYRCRLSADNTPDVFSSVVSLNISSPSSPTILNRNSEACASTTVLQVQGFDKYRWTLANSVLPDTLSILNQIIVQQGQFLVNQTLVGNFKEGITKLYLTSTNTLGCSRLDSLFLTYYPNEKAVLSSNPIVGDSVRLFSQPIVRGNITYSGTWSTKGTAEIKNLTSNNTIVNKLSSGLNTFVFTSNNFCRTKDSIGIIRITTPGIPVVFSGKDSTSCDSTISLKATPITQLGYRGYWRITGKKANGIIITDTTTAVTSAKLSLGANVFIWTVTNGQNSSSDTVTYTRSGLPNKPTIASVSSEACSTSQVLQITISANDASNKYKWTRMGAQGTDTLRIVSSQIQQGTQDTSIISTTVNNYKTGTNTLLLTTTNASKCFRTDQASLAYFPNEIPVLSNNAIIGDSIRLTAQSVVRGNVTYQGTWSTKRNAIIKNPSSPSTVANKLSIGANKFIYTLNNFCKTRDSLSVTYLPSGSVNAGKDTATCSDSIVLAAIPAPLGYSGVWRSTNKSLIFKDSTLATTNVSSLAIGANTLIWSIKSGVTIIDSDTLKVTKNAKPIPQIETFMSVCKADTNLNAKLNSGETGTWRNIGTNSSRIIAATIPNTRVIGLGRFKPESTRMLNLFEWTVSNGACEAKDTLSVFLADSIKILTDTISGIAGELIQVKVYKDYTTSFSGIFQGLKVVGVLDKSIIDTSYTQGDTSVFFQTSRKLLTKKYSTNYSLTNSCGIVSEQATLTIASRNVPPNKKTIQQTVSQDSSPHIITIAGYDLDSNRYITQVKILKRPSSGANLRVEISSDGSSVSFFIDYATVKDFKGKDSFSFRLYDQEDSTTIDAFLDRDIDLGLEIYNAVSPNGDGKHDVFEIKGIEQEIYKNNKVEIFNRWGDRVYTQSGYNNKDVAFDGGTLPDGTYYYVLDLGNDRKIFKGFLLLSR